MDGPQPGKLGLRIEIEDRPVREDDMGSAAGKIKLLPRTGTIQKAHPRDEIHLVHEVPLFVLQDNELSSEMAEVTGLVNGAYETHFGTMVIADTDNIAVAVLVHLCRRSESHIDVTGWS